MPSPERLYLADPLRLAFEAQVVAHVPHQGRMGVVLDRTAFYAEAGGQMADHGRLDGGPVVDVQLGGDGRIVHLLDGELPPVGATVQGRVDEARRRQHMAMHTGQHILSRALLDVAAAHTVSSRLGETTCTIDVRPGAVGSVERARIEQRANDVIDADQQVRCFFPTPSELAKLPLRKPSKVDEDVRVVAVGDFDFVPCGGTHCVRTSQVGLVSIISVERYKKGQRVTFVAGARARSQLGREAAQLRDIARSMSCSAEELGAALAKQRRDFAESQQEVARLERQLAGHLARSLAERAVDPARVIAVLEGASVTLLRAVAHHIVEQPGAVALLASQGDDGLHVVATRAAQSRFDCGRFIQRVAEACGGRGGGRGDHAEGRLPSSVDWGELVRQLVSAVE